ncbi:MAG: sugar phosphate isomerase/epimerase [Actinomycetota bacterium]
MPDTPTTVLTPATANRVATAPISWGICEVPGWGHQLPVHRVLAEMAGLGFTHTELGSAGWLPEEPAALATVLDEHGLSLLASFVPLVLHRPEAAEDALARAAEAANLLSRLGARYFNTAPVTTYDWAPRTPLTDAEWDHLFAMIGRVEQICADAGLHQVVHEHVGCVIETRDDIDRLLAGTEVDLVLDTGHLALGGYDPLEFATDHGDRVGLVHLKDLDLEVGQRLHDDPMTLMAAVQGGLFPPLGAGDLPLAKVVATLEAGGYQGWYVVEQDCAITGPAPEIGAGPVLDVADSLSYLERNITTFSETQE